MKTEIVKLSSLKGNPNNPRVIKDEKFNQLVQSIKNFQQMLEIRPIVVDENGVVKRKPQDDRFSTFEPCTDVKDLFNPDALMIPEKT